MGRSHRQRPKQLFSSITVKEVENWQLLFGVFQERKGFSRLPLLQTHLWIDESFAQHQAFLLKHENLFPHRGAESFRVYGSRLIPTQKAVKVC